MSAVHTLTYKVTYWCDCCICGVPIYASQQTERECRNDSSRYWYCINGHSQHFTGKSEEQKLKEQLEEKERQLAAARAREQMARNNERSARHGAAIARGKLRAQLERIKNGVCPCCNRSFQNVRRHMASKHPDVLERLKAHESEGGSK